MKKAVLLIILGFFVLIACNQDNASTIREASVLYESKPLALLMLHMYDESAQWKEAILKDSFAVEFPMDFYGIYTVEATDSTIRNEVFIAQADVYLKTVKDLVETSKENKPVKKYNSTIDACIACHQVFCQGPIDKIKYLYIEE